MNKINFNQTAGFPLTTNTLDELQKAYSVFNSFANIAGELAIISGCVQTGSNISSGFVAIQGEVYPFKGGTKTSKVIISKNTITETFEDGSLKPVYDHYYVEFGNAAQSYDFNSFQRITNLIDLDNYAKNINQNLLNTVTLLNQAIDRLEILENKPDVFREPATQIEVNQRVIETKYVSPKTLPQPTILLTGEISSTGNRVSYHGSIFTCTRVTTGRYRINHSIGNTKYGVVGSGVNGYDTVQLGVYERKSSYCIVGLSDDASLNNADFSFQIFKI